MKTVHHVVVCLSRAASGSGCTFGLIAPDPKHSALSVQTPSFAGDARVGDWNVMGTHGSRDSNFVRDVQAGASVWIAHGLAIVADALDRGTREHHGG